MRAYLVWVQSLPSSHVLLAPVIDSTRLDVHGRSVSPVGDDPNSVQGRQSPHFGSVEVLRSDSRRRDRRANERRVVADGSFGHTGEVRDPGIDDVEGVVLPPHNRRPGPFSNESVVENDGLADIEFPAKCSERGEIGALDARLGSGVTRGGRERDLGERIGSLTKVESQQRAIAIIDRLKVREPSSLGGNHGDGVGSECSSVQGGVDPGKRRPESFDVPLQRNGTSVDDEP